MVSRILLENGVIEEDTIPNFLNHMHNFTPIDLGSEEPSQEALKKLPFDIARDYLAFPIKVFDNGMQITMVEPTDTAGVEELQDRLRTNLQVGVSSYRSVIDACWRRRFRRRRAERASRRGLASESPF